MSALLTVAGVTKRFRGLIAVDRVSFEVPQGGIFAVIGPNGAGKTTLFNMIAGVFRPESGTIDFAGEQDRRALAGPDLPAWYRAGPFRSCVRFPHSSVEDNVIIGALLHRKPRSGGARAHAHEVLRRLDLYGKRDTARVGTDAARSQACWK